MLLGLHHVTAFAGDAQTNLDFYTQVMGLRLIKRTVNFDDPGTYHFYFGDANGTPGTILTFFPWPTAPPGRAGTGQSAGVSFAIPKNALDSWIARLERAHVFVGLRLERLGEPYIQFCDPHGLHIELFATEPERDDPAIVRLHSQTLWEAEAGQTVAFLMLTFGARYISSEAHRTLYQIGESILDVHEMRSGPGGAPAAAKLSAGTVHHIAWRVRDEAAQLEWRSKLTAAGFRVTRVIDRQYFKSIYFREPGGVLFEIATDGPGFFVDESELGTALKLPPWLEPIRESLERRLPEVRLK